MLSRLFIVETSDLTNVGCILNIINILRKLVENGMMNEKESQRWSGILVFCLCTLGGVIFDWQ